MPAVQGEEGMKLAYADPPYMGQAKRHYKNDPSGIPAQEVDYWLLTAKLLQEYDGFALSASSTSMLRLNQMFYGDNPYKPTNPDIRIAPWCKPHCSWKPWNAVPYTYEIVYFRSVRIKGQRIPQSPRDHCVCSSTRQQGTHGAKPVAFCEWILDLIGFDETRDTIDDLYPGSGVFTKVASDYLHLTR